jgi:hypothetical protein
MVTSPPRLWPLTDCTTNCRPVISSERAHQDEEQGNFPAKQKEKVKSGRGPQRGAWHQDILTDWLTDWLTDCLSVLKWLRLRPTTVLSGSGSAWRLADPYSENGPQRDIKSNATNELLMNPKEASLRYFKQRQDRWNKRVCVCVCVCVCAGGVRVCACVFVSLLSRWLGKCFPCPIITVQYHHSGNFLTAYLRTKTVLTASKATLVFLPCVYKELISNSLSFPCSFRNGFSAKCSHKASLKFNKLVELWF